MTYRKYEQDKGFAWAILAITLIYNIIEASVYMSPAIYMMVWDEEFEVTKRELGTVSALLNGVASLTGIVSL